MSSGVFVKRIKAGLVRITVLIFAVLPAFIIILSAIRWRPAYNTGAFNAGEFPGAVFPGETVTAYSIAGHDKPPNIAAALEESRPGLPADAATPGEIAGAFYRAARENAGNTPGPARNRPPSGEDAGPPRSPGTESADGEFSADESGGEERRLVGFIRDTENVEYRYFKDRKSGKITVVTTMPENLPANSDEAEKEALP
jgi:hypothetical protein